MLCVCLGWRAIISRSQVGNLINLNLDYVILIRFLATTVDVERVFSQADSFCLMSVAGLVCSPLTH